MAKDAAPLYFDVRLGGLFPANAAAENAMREIAGRVKCVITGGIANQRRRSLYWVLAGIVVELLNDKHAMTLDETDIHDIMRDKFRMYDEQVLPSGEVHRKRWPTSNRAMNEADRADYLNKCIGVWSTWTGVPIDTLRREGQEQAA